MSRRTHVLRVPRSDDEDGSFVLVHVTPSTSKKARPLDVKVVATEGEYPYVVTLRHTDVGALKTSGSSCSAEEWEHILESLLLEREVLEGIQLTAAVSSGLEIAVRKKVQGITQRLGTVSLKKNEKEEDSDVTEWCGIAIESREELRAALATANAKAAELEQAVAGLSSQLDELIKAKQEHDTDLIEKFCLLLNEKKSKIREQEKIIRRARLDPATLAPSREGSAESGRVPVASRRSKRKVPTAPATEDESSDDGFQRMDVDAKGGSVESAAREELSEDQQTTDADDDATASEPDDEVAMEQVTAASDKSQTAAQNHGQEPKSSSPLPPRRTLPFSTRSQGPSEKGTGKPSMPAGSETESDDEL